MTVRGKGSTKGERALPSYARTGNRRSYRCYEIRTDIATAISEAIGIAAAPTTPRGDLRLVRSHISAASGYTFDARRNNHSAGSAGVLIAQGRDPRRSNHPKPSAKPLVQL